MRNIPIESSVFDARFSEFWTEAKTGLVVFMDPKVYGRSPLEASSFIASSAYTDKKYVRLRPCDCLY